MNMERPSFLELELFVLGELSPEARARVEELASADPALSSEIEKLRADRLTLRPLPSPPAARTRWGMSLLAWLGAGGAGLGLAAASVLLSVPGPMERTKGEEVLLAVVAEREGVIRASPRVVRADDRLRVLVTCSPEQSGEYELVVIENGASSFPLSRGKHLACGNRVALPGAFRMVDAPPRFSVCLLLGGSLPERSSLQQSLPERATCIELAFE